MKSPVHLKPLLRGTVLVLAVFLAGCASGPMADPRDPLEPLNRGIYGFNDKLDRALIRPVAKVYRGATPSFVQTGVGNFFGNLSDAWSMVNNALQLKGQAAVESFMRVSVNTVFGFVGVLDIASEMGIERKTEDFGQTLGHWGVRPGPYVVLPLLGPSTLRDSLALPLDFQGDPAQGVGHVPTRNTLTALKLVDARAGFLDASAVLDGAALDPYTFTRDAHLQRRRNAVFDGNPPEEAMDAPQGQSSF